MTTRLQPTAYRKRTFQFLRRSLRFHANTTGVSDLDVTELTAALAANRRDGVEPTLAAALIKATGLVLAEIPQLNRHLFHGLFGRYEVQFDEIHCTVLVARKAPDGEIVVLPCVLRNADRASIHEIAAKLVDFKKLPLEQLPEYVALQRLGKMPWLARKWFGFKSRSDHRFHEKYIVGTYGISSFMSTHAVPSTVTHAVSPYGCSFFPGMATDRPWVVDGKIVVRRIMPMTIVVDHYLFDGGEAIMALTRLGALLGDPTTLGLARPAPPIALAGGTT